MWIPLLLTFCVVAYNNLVNRWRPFHSWAYVPANLAFAATVSVMGLAWGPPWGEIAPVGDLPISLAPLLPVAAFAVGAFSIARSCHAHRIADKRVSGLHGGELAFHVLVRIPVGTAIVEELVFRGVLFSLWRFVDTSAFTAALYPSIAFGLWHVAPTVIGLRMNDPEVDKHRILVAVVAAVLATTGVGLGFAWLRVVTGGLLAPILLHAGVNSVGVLAAVVASRRMGSV